MREILISTKPEHCKKIQGGERVMSIYFSEAEKRLLIRQIGQFKKKLDKNKREFWRFTSKKEREQDGNTTENQSGVI